MPMVDAGEITTELFPVQTVEGTITERFDLMANRHGSKEAIVAESRILTYDDLRAQSLPVASQLGEELDPAACRLVALLLEDPVDQIVAMLGVLRAGHAFVALDVTQPDQRLQSQLQGCTALLTTETQRDRAKVLHETSMALVTFDEKSIPICGPVRKAITTDLAYVIYTSGSTGKPKGVMLAHRNLLHNVMRYTHDAKITEEDRLTLLFSCSFGAGLLDVFSALLNGATLYPISVKQHDGVNGLAGRLREQEITIYHSVPTLFRQLCSMLENSKDKLRVRLVKLTGDRSYRSDAEAYRRCFPDHCQLLNSLGITEAGLVRHYFMNKETALSNGMLPVGYPVQDMHLDLVDADGHPGMEGEVVIRSDYLALGYWEQPELTKKVFRTHEGERAYWTGDFARVDLDGCVHLTGREGAVVNVNGYRIDVGEVEQGLLSNPDVSGAAVVGWDDGEGGHCLAAYVAPKDGQALPLRGVRNALRDRLPDYMLPSKFVFLKELPLTATGKVDRRQLPDLNSIETSMPVSPSAIPVTDTERRLASIWEAILGGSPIGRDTDFFDSGGGSLQAVTVCSEIRKVFGKQVDVSELFESPTIEALGALIDHDASQLPREVVVPINPAGSLSPLYLVHGLTGEVIHYFNLKQYLGSDRPLHGLQLPDREFSSVKEMAQHYCEELQRHQPEGPYHLAGYSFGGMVAYEMARLLTESGSEVAFVGLIEAMSPNLGWSEMRWRMALLSHWAMHLPGWMGEILGRPAEVSRAIRRRLSRWTKRRSHLQTPIVIEDFAAEHQFKVEGIASLSRNHTPQTYAGRVHLFRTSVLGFHHVDPEMGWGRCARGGVSIQRVSGHHEDMLYEPHVESLAKALQGCLDALPGSRSKS